MCFVNKFILLSNVYFKNGHHHVIKQNNEHLQVIYGVKNIHFLEMLTMTIFMYSILQQNIFCSIYIKNECHESNDENAYYVKIIYYFHLLYLSHTHPPNLTHPIILKQCFRFSMRLHLTFLALEQLTINRP